VIVESKILHKREKINYQSRKGYVATVNFDKYVPYIVFY